MLKSLKWPLFTVLALFGGNAFAHNGPFPHPEAASEWAHMGMHLLMALPLGAGVFFLGRWLARRHLQAKTLPLRKR